MSLTDMYVQVKYDEQLFSVFDDTESILVQSVIDGLDEWRDSSGERSDAAIIAFLRKVLSHEDVNHALHSLDIIPPFSVVLVDNEMEPVADLVTLDDENIYLHDDFWEKMDKEQPPLNPNTPPYFVSDINCSKKSSSSLSIFSQKSSCK